MKTRSFTQTALLAMLAGSTQALADSFPAVIELSSLDGTNGYVLNGIDPGDQCGGAVSAAGDVNGDGIDDILIGARLANYASFSNGGEVHVVYGGPGVGASGSVELADVAGAGAGNVFGGTTTDLMFGNAVARGDDFNADGTDDFFVGARGFSSDTGATFVYTGGSTVVFTGVAAGDFSGASVASAGDVNNDGVPDLITGAPNSDANGVDSGASYVVFGGAGVSSLGLGALNGTNGFTLPGAGAGDNSGSTVSGAGDVNNDGVDDFIIGAFRADPNGNSSGTSYVVFGGAGIGASGMLPLASINGTNGFLINGISGYDASGCAVSSAGDFNGDGVADLLIGARYGDPNGSQSGECYIVFGGAGVGASGEIELSTLDGTNGFVLNGVAAGDQNGFDVSCAGDVNGDGVDDVVLSSRLASPDGLAEAGTTYVVFGGADVGVSGSLELSMLDGTNGFAVNGVAADDRSGVSVSAAGDVNGDGIADVLIGATGVDTNGASSGAAYVVFGIPTLAERELSDLDGSNGFVINGIDSGDRSGRSVSSAGDVNGDGVDDLIIGADRADPNGAQSGESYVVFGGASVGSTGTIELLALNGANGFVLNGIDESEISGGSVSSAGDVNGDGIADLIIGARYASPNGNSFAGGSYVVFGGAGIGSTGTIELSSLNGANGFVVSGIDAFDQCGTSVSSAGDVNGDGVDDIIISAYGADPNGINLGGESYVVFGGAGVGASGSIELSSLNGTNGYVVNGIDASDFSGFSVSSAGDVNGDGVDDIVIGALGAGPNGEQSGESYVVFGGASVGGSGSIELSSLNGTNGFVVNGIDVFDRSGSSVSSAGDVNGDGVDDLIIGADLADPNGNDYAGESYVVFGGASVGSSGMVELSALNGTNGFVLNGIDAFDNSGRSVSSAGDVNGDGVDDIIISAYRADPNGINIAGESYVVFGGAGVGARGSIELSSLNGTNGFILNGIDASDLSGSSVSSAGDVNGDGVDDLIIGAPNADPNGNSSAGESYVVFGVGQPSPPNPADFSGDGCVDSADLAILLAAWASMTADLNGDMITDSGDLAILLAAWGSGC